MPANWAGSIGHRFSWRDSRSAIRASRASRKGRRASLRHGLNVSTLARTKEAVYLFKLRSQGVSLNLRQKVFLLLNEPTSSVEAFRLSIAMWVVILSSCACGGLETVDFITFQTGPGLWVAFRWVFNIFFSVEAAVRMAAYQGKNSRAWHDMFIWLDLIAVIPFWLRVAFSPHTLSGSSYLESSERTLMMRTFEACSAIRLLKLSRYFEGSALLVRAVQRSLAQLSVR